MSPTIRAEYLGLQLISPILVGACPMTANPECVRDLTLAGAGAIVLPSLLEEHVVHDRIERGQLASDLEASVESMFYDQVAECPCGGQAQYLEIIGSLKRTTGIPVIAGLNGCTSGSWLSVAAEIAEAGADALEVVLESDCCDCSLSADQVEETLVESIRELCRHTHLPITVKLSHFHTNLGNLALRLSKSGAKGIVCFAHAPTWQVQTDRIAASMTWALTPANSINPTISGLIRVRAAGSPISLAASGGICSPEDVIKAVIAGADVAVVTSEIYRTGPDIIAHLVEGLANYLTRHKFETFSDFVKARPAPQTHARGSVLRSVARSHHISDPTPHPSRQTGDRWGHLD